MAKKTQDESWQTIPVDHIAIFKAVEPQLLALLHELRELSKKQPDAKINKFKLALINEKVADANVVFGTRWKPLRNFEQFDEIELPSNSDVVLVLAQYTGALTRWKRDNTYHDHSHKQVWKTSPPLEVN